MKIRDLMTSPAVTVRPEATIAEAASRMIETGVSGLPVVDSAGALVGIITEGDLLHRAESASTRRPSWWLRLLTDDKSLAAEYAKANGRFVSEVMTRSIVAIDADAPAARAAELMDQLQVKRLPVMEKGKLIGVIARRDLLKLISEDAGKTSGGRSDAAIASAIRHDLNIQPWITLAQVAFDVKDGVVRLSGRVSAESQHQALRALIENVPGVTRIDDQLTVSAAIG